MRTYKGVITELKENEVAIIGSNPVGINGNPRKGKGGAMLHALNSGWVKQGEKLNNCFSNSGKVYGLVTILFPGHKRSVSPDQFKQNILSLYKTANEMYFKDFYVFYSATGRNLNGYTSNEIAEFFASFPVPDNIIFEEAFCELVKGFIINDFIKDFEDGKDNN